MPIEAIVPTAAGLQKNKDGIEKASNSKFQAPENSQASKRANAFRSITTLRAIIAVACPKKNGIARQSRRIEKASNVKFQASENSQASKRATAFRSIATLPAI